MHTPAHTADALKFLARNRHFAAGNLPRLLDAVRAKLESSDVVFVWGENDRIAWALHAALRRPDADPAAFDSWTARWVQDHTALGWGPYREPIRFAQVENAKQILRSLVAIVDGAVAHRRRREGAGRRRDIPRPHAERPLAARGLIIILRALHGGHCR